MTTALRITAPSRVFMYVRLAAPQLHDNFLSPKHQDCLAMLAENTRP